METTNNKKIDFLLLSKRMQDSQDLIDKALQGFKPSQDYFEELRTLSDTLNSHFSALQQQAESFWSDQAVKYEKKLIELADAQLKSPAQQLSAALHQSKDLASQLTVSDNKFQSILAQLSFLAEKNLIAELENIGTKITNSLTIQKGLLEKSSSDLQLLDSSLQAWREANVEAQMSNLVTQSNSLTRSFTNLQTTQNVFLSSVQDAIQKLQLLKLPTDLIDFDQRFRDFVNNWQTYKQAQNQHLTKLENDLNTANQTLISIQKTTQASHSHQAQTLQHITTAKTSLEQHITTAKTSLEQRITAAKTSLEQHITTAKTSLEQYITSAKSNVEAKQQLLLNEITRLADDIKMSSQQIANEIQRNNAANDATIKALRWQQLIIFVLLLIAMIIIKIVK